jgi:hypothetical protein
VGEPNDAHDLAHTMGPMAAETLTRIEEQFATASIEAEGKGSQSGAQQTV